MKFCKDCKWYLLDMGHALCVSPQNPKKVNKVTGEEEYITKFCDNQREYHLNYICGPNGKWWEAK